MYQGKSQCDTGGQSPDRYNGDGRGQRLACLERAREVASGRRLVHGGARSALPSALDRIFDLLRPGDIVTHCFHSFENNVLNESGRIRPEVTEAKAKGIVLDTGAVRSNFGVDLFRTAIQQGLLPDTLGTDIVRTTPRNPVVYTLPEVMTIFMGLGMSLDEVVAASTDTARRPLVSGARWEPWAWEPSAMLRS